MQLLTFTIGGQQYGIDTRNIVEVLPFISAQELPQQAKEIRGLIRYRGKLLPAVDLCQLILDRPCQLRLGTRTIVLKTIANDADDTSILFAITAEDVVGISTTTFDSMNYGHSDSFMGPIVDAKSNTTDKLSIQIIVVKSLQNNKNLQTLMSYTRQELGQHKAGESDLTR